MTQYSAFRWIMLLFILSFTSLIPAHAGIQGFIVFTDFGMRRNDRGYRLQCAEK